MTGFGKSYEFGGMGIVGVVRSHARHIGEPTHTFPLDLVALDFRKVSEVPSVKFAENSGIRLPLRHTYLRC